MLTIGLIFLGGLGLFLGLPNFLFTAEPALLLFTPFCLFLLGARAGTNKKALLHGWLTGAIGQSLALYWMSRPLNEVAGLPLLPSQACIVLLSMYLSIYYALTCLAMRLLYRYWQKDRQGRSLAGLLVPPLAGGLAFGGAEILCGVLFTGFPWLNLASGFVARPSWIQAASIIGSYGLSAWLAAGASCLAMALVVQGKKQSALIGVCGLVIIMAVPCFGLVRLGTAKSGEKDGEGAVTARFVQIQGCIDQSEKWTAEYQQKTVEHYLGLSAKGLTAARSMGSDADFTVLLWPETSMPFSFQTEPYYADQVRSFAVANKVNLGLGTIYYMKHPGGGHTLANRFIMLNPNGGSAGHYDKEHLVPFGEYLPPLLDFEFLHALMQGQYFTAGKDVSPIYLRKYDPLADAPLPPLKNGQPQVVRPGDNSKSPSLALGILICYETIFPELAHERVAAGAEILITVSNDAWFGLTSAPMQHLYLAAMRAVEQKRPLVRCTNTGYTSFVDEYGQIEKIGALFMDQIMIQDVRPQKGRTIYSHLHPFMATLLVLVPLAAIAIGRRSAKRRQANAPKR